MAVFWAPRHLEPVVFSQGNGCVRCWVIFSRQLGGDWWSFVAQPECWRQRGVNSWEFSEKTTCYLKGGGLLPHPLQPFICGSMLTTAAHPVSAPDTVKSPPEINIRLSQKGGHTPAWLCIHRKKKSFGKTYAKNSVKFAWKSSKPNMPPYWPSQRAFPAATQAIAGHFMKPFHVKRRAGQEEDEGC